MKQFIYTCVVEVTSKLTASRMQNLVIVTPTPLRLLVSPCYGVDDVTCLRWCTGPQKMITTLR